MTEVLLWSGVALIIIGAIRLVIDAFRTHILWGIAVILLSPITSLIYAILHWPAARTSVKMQLLGVALLFIALFVEGSFKKPFEWQQEYTPVIEWSDKSSAEYVSPSSSHTKFRCDGRQHCSQMTSRAEAEFFVRNCPDTKMDGDNDGIPCETDSRF